MNHEPVAEIAIHDEGDRMGASWTMLKAGYELPAGRYALFTHPAPVNQQFLEALKLIAETGMDARKCMLVARAAIAKLREVRKCS